jgi:hypothetical protein
MLEDAGGKWGNAVAKRETLVVSSTFKIVRQARALIEDSTTVTPSEQLLTN